MRRKPEELGADGTDLPVGRQALVAGQRVGRHAVGGAERRDQDLLATSAELIAVGRPIKEPMQSIRSWRRAAMTVAVFQ